MVKESSLIQKEKFMKVLGKMIKLMVLVFMCILMELDMKDIGDTTFSMDKEKKLGQMAHSL